MGHPVEMPARGARLHGVCPRIAIAVQERLHLAIVRERIEVAEQDARLAELLQPRHELHNLFLTAVGVPDLCGEMRDGDRHFRQAWSTRREAESAIPQFDERRWLQRIGRKESAILPFPWRRRGRCPCTRCWA